MRTALQKHVDFFDRNKDGRTRVWETYQGLRALKLGRVASAGAALFINAALARKTGAAWYEPLTVYNDNIALGKHGGDTGIYDADGNFVQDKFEELWTKHDADHNDQLDQAEIDQMYLANDAGLGSKAEFGLLMKLAGTDTPNGRVLTKQTLTQFYDGSLFYIIAGEPVP